MTKKMRIVHVISGLGVGGAESVLYQLLLRLNTTDFEHVVIYFHSGPYVEKMKKLGVELHHIQGLFCTYDPFFLYRLITSIKNSKPDCLHTLLWAANFLGRLIASSHTIPHVEVFHNNIDQNGFFRNMLDRLTAKKHGSVVAVSEGVAESLHTYAPWFTYPYVHIIKNGIEPFEIDSSDKVYRAQLGYSDTHFVIGMVGRFEWVKNYPLLLTAFALLYDENPDARLLLIGVGSQESILRTRVYDLGIYDRVTFVVGQDAKKYYELFDCFVMPSLKEGISIALLEAMSHTIPPIVMASTAGKHDVVVDEDNGLLVYNNDPQELASVICVLLHNQSLRIRLGENAKTTVEKQFKIEVMINQYNDLYQKVLNQELK